jgi:bacillithiol biosynthesis cysteine-adding enzyme BshC
MLEVIRERLSLGVLARQIAENRAPAGWGMATPRGTDQWRQRAVATASSAPGDWLAAVGEAIQPESLAADRINAVARTGGVLVTTGQQPGLFGGPLYTWYKAITALALANAIERECGIAAAPLFWAATDDSDIEEAGWTAIAVRGGSQLLRMHAEARDGTPMALLQLGDVSKEISALRAASTPIAYPDYPAFAERGYSGPATVGSAYVALLRAVLQPLGIAVLDAAHASVRQAAHSVLRSALQKADSIAAAVSERNEEIRLMGIEPQVHDVAALSLVFRHTDGVRLRIPVSESRSVAQGNHAALSPNVLLRPIVERSILPTVAYVGGPAELAYFAQSAAVCRVLDVAAPVAVPRYSGLIVEEHIRRILGKYNLTPGELASPHEAWSRLARAGIPADVLDALSELRSAAELSFDRILRGTTEGSSPIFPDAAIVSGARETVQHRIMRFERRLIAAAKRRDAQLADDIATARGALFPLGRKQERALNIIPLLARHGEDLIAKLMEAASEHAQLLMSGVTPQYAAQAARAGFASTGE